jgi:inosine-uridine nucleoside N-ribohydrolase
MRTNASRVTALIILTLCLLPISNCDAGTKKNKQNEEQQVNILKESFILDTDIGPDCDDAAAIALAILYARQSEKALLSVMHCTSSPWGVGTIRNILNWYQASEIPVGTLKDQGFLEGAEFELYNKTLAKMMKEEEREAGDSVSLYREILHKQEDQSVHIIAIGPLRNLSNLLNSSGDSVTLLTGHELIAKKVSQLTLMAGSFEEGSVNSEWNILMDIKAAQNVAENWPGKMVYCGFEVGYPIIALREPNDLNPINPVRLAYRLHSRGEGRNSWDLCTVQWAFFPESSFYQCSSSGVISINDQGVTQWKTSSTGDHYYLKLIAPPDEVARSFESELIHFDHQ